MKKVFLAFGAMRHIKHSFSLVKNLPQLIKTKLKVKIMLALLKITVN